MSAKALSPTPLCHYGHIGRNVRFFFFMYEKVYVFETRKAWNVWFCNKKISCWQWKNTVKLFESVCRYPYKQIWKCLCIFLRFRTFRAFFSPPNNVFPFTDNFRSSFFGRLPLVKGYKKSYFGVTYIFLFYCLSTENYSKYPVFSL